MTKELNATVVQHQVQIDELRRSIGNIATRINEFYRQIETLHEKPDVPADFAALKATSQSRLNSLEELTKDTARMLNETTTRFNALEKSHSDLRKMALFEQTRLSRTQGDHIVSESNLKKEIQKLSDMIETSLTTNQTIFKEMCKKFIDSLSASPVSILDSNKEVAKRLEEVRRGIDNSLYRSKSLEDKINSIDERVKKLEGK